MKKILVIDDEWKIRKLIKDYLVREGYSVDEAGDGEEGLELFFKNNYDIVILDIMMPKIDGWSVCRKIREESQVPIIMLTARADESDQLFGFELETEIRKLIKDYLVREGYSVDEAGDGEEGLELFFKNHYDIVILDIMMPKIDGWSVCRKIREESQVPIIMLTARADESDQLFGFELETDEYMVKPFNPKLLVAKVKALFRRDGKIAEKACLQFRDLVVDTSKREVRLGDIVLELTPKEYDLLYFFIENKGLALSREKILNSVWGWDYFGDSRTVDTHIKRLRKKIGDDFIQTVRGFGYKFEGEK